MSVTAISAPCVFSRALRPSSRCTKARTGYPAFSSSATTTLPVFPVAPVTRILGLSMIVSRQFGTHWYQMVALLWYYAVPTVKRDDDDYGIAVKGASGRRRRS